MSKTDRTTDDDQHRAAPEGEDISSQADTEPTDADVWAEFDAMEAKTDPDAGTDGAGEDDFSGPDTDDPDADAAEGKDDPSAKGSPDTSARTGAQDDPEGGDGQAQEGSQALDPEALQAQIEKLTQQVSSEEGRRRKAQRDAEKWRKRAAELRNAKQDDRQQPDESLEALRQDYPDMAPLADHVMDLRKTISESSQERAEEAQEQLDEILDQQWGILTTEHPDAGDILGNRQTAATLKEWVMDPHQPRYLQDIFEQNRKAIVDGIGAALLVSHFKAALAKADAEAGNDGSSSTAGNREADRRQRQLDGASASRRNKSPRVNRNEPPEGASPEEDWEYFERMDREKARQRAAY